MSYLVLHNSCFKIKAFVSRTAGQHWFLTLSGRIEILEVQLRYSSLEGGVFLQEDRGIGGLTVPRA